MANLVDELIAQNGEEPRFEVGPFLPKVLPRERSLQTCLYKVVSRVTLSRQFVGKAAQCRDLARNPIA